MNQQITMPTDKSEHLAQQFQKKVKQHGSLTIIPVAQGIVDVFQGQGWATHSRYRNYRNRWFWLAGARIEAERLPDA